MKRAVFTGHALLQMQRRAIPEDIVKKIIETPGQTEGIRPGRLVFQSQIMMGDPPVNFVIRVFVDVTGESLEVVTVYRTRKVQKYWR
jgi:hypothetical protein